MAWGFAPRAKAAGPSDPSLAYRYRSANFGGFVADSYALAPEPKPAPRPSVPAAPAPVAAAEHDGEAISFICGSPAVGRFPRARWLSCLRQVGFFRDAAMWDYAPPAGSPA